MRRPRTSTPINLLHVTAIIGLTIAFLTACAAVPQDERLPATPTRVIQIAQHFSYGLVPRWQMIELSDVIFVGKVVSISPTTWNQDSGEYWERGMQLHFVELEIVQAIVDELGLGRRVTLTVWGSSPLDGRSDHHLKVGDQAVVFASRREIAWRGGRRPVLMLANAPDAAYYVLGGDGFYSAPTGKESVSFDELIGWIAQERDTLIQPSVPLPTPTPYGLLQPRPEWPFANAESVSPAEAQARVPFVIPLPESLVIQEAWASPLAVEPSERAVAFEFSNGVVLIVHEQWEQLDWEGIVAANTEFETVVVNVGFPGIGAEAGRKEIDGQIHSYPASVQWSLSHLVQWSSRQVVQWSSSPVVT